ncbi:AraC family transcriptional regulator [Sinorhizobium mexicanum]|uniref:AraC family transcriptional regulator n=1 Tax=Sinorhizobium mexicanum TaxID=375549 RepID=A0A859QXW0_9HYPH|nr:AraC family transcriptional regulator [Sinorhizobium mexicanum]QLL63721.1 AraC family transcriptional regulator [Sinorhizobium mexicanum]
MQTISQEQAIEAMPLKGTEQTRFWRDARFKGMECLSATFITHEFAPHAHDTFSIGAIEAGSQISTIKGERSQTGPGDLYLINPDEIHDGHPGLDGYRYRMIYPSVDLLVDVLEDVTGRAFRGTPCFSRLLLRDPELAVAFHRAHGALEGKAGALEADEGMFSFLAKLFQRHGTAIILPVETRAPSAVHRARDYLIANYSRDLGLDELAEVAGLSRAHLIRAFRREFHITPHAFLTDKRVREAKALLRQGWSAIDTAYHCGFADQAHFSRHFKARTGVTPGAFRAG